VQAGALVLLVIPLLAILFNGVNAYINGRWVFHLSGGYELGWLWDPRFIAGLALFVAGFAANKHADYVLMHLRRPGETGYKVPHGGLYQYVSCPNYLGECVQWFGWSLMTLSPAAWVFLLWTLANLLPRAISHQKWYQQTFKDYPADRKAMLPFLL